MELIDTIKVNNRTIRDILSYKGVIIYHETTVPINPFKKQEQFAVVDYLVPESENTINWYCGEGLGNPIFRGNEICLEEAKKFIDKIKG